MDQTEWPRGPPNELHAAAAGLEILGEKASAGFAATALSSGKIDIDQGCPRGWSPLMYTADTGHTRVAKYLLKKGANPEVAGDGGFTALILAAQEGHLAVTKLLIKAGSRLEAATCLGATPLHLAAGGGHREVTRALIQAGGNFDNRTCSGETPLYSAAQGGRVEVIKELLRARADPLLKRTNRQTWRTSVPLDTAVENGRREVVRLLIQELGLRGCGGDSRGVDALKCAPKHQHVDIMVMLADAGVVDTGAALKAGGEHGREASVKFLLQQKAGESARKRTAYVNVLDESGAPPLLPSIEAALPFSVKVVRMLIDAGADTTSTVGYTNVFGAHHSETPLEFTNALLSHKIVEGELATKEQLCRLEVIRRLMMQVEAVHAVSWLWPTKNGDAAAAPASLGRAAKGKEMPKNTDSIPSMPPAEETASSSVVSTTVGMAASAVSWLWRSGTAPSSTVHAVSTSSSPSPPPPPQQQQQQPVGTTVPITRQSNRRRRVLLGALYRYSHKP